MTDLGLTKRDRCGQPQGVTRATDKRTLVRLYVSSAESALFSMLSAKPQLNLKNAREYFRGHFYTGDYYSAGQKVMGEWFGQSAEMLGLKAP